MSTETAQTGTAAATTAETPAAKPTFWERVKAFFVGVARELYKIAMPAVKSAVTDFLNDKDVQKTALSAVQAAISKGLRGDDAWTEARAAFESAVKAAGKEASATLLDTVLQNAYCAVKYSVTSAESPTA